MKLKKLSLAICAILLLSGYKPVPQNANKDWYHNGIQTAQFQLRSMAKTINNLHPDSTFFPRSITPENKIRLVGMHDWTSGFFPGSLWYAYELTGDKQLAHEARIFTEKLSELQFYKGIHDVGFMMYCSYGNGIRLMPSTNDSLVLINTAKSLSTRFHPQVGLIKSWDHEPAWKYPVIIDNMMNLELLFEVSKITSDNSYKNIAISHADKTMKNHFRPDMSTYHLVSYDPETGAVLTKETHQGYSNSSAWARGQGWGLYGYIVCYRYTHDKKYLDWAEKIAAYIMSSVKTDDKIPYWDYNAPDIPKAPRDASAAAVTASALMELSQITVDGNKYFNYAEKILKSLSSDNYLAKKGTNNHFILMHSVGSYPHDSEVNMPLNYADYYYLEGMKRYNDIINKNEKLQTIK
ncbi:MAG: glycoside hydrolase family 88 protein [Paludibacter sp.]